MPGSLGEITVIFYVPLFRFGTLVKHTRYSASPKCPTADAGDAVRKHNAGQAVAKLKCTSTDSGDAVWNRNAGQAGATGERTIADAGNAAIGRNLAGATALDQRLAFCFNQAVSGTVIHCVAFFNLNAGQAGTTCEC